MTGLDELADALPDATAGLGDQGKDDRGKETRDLRIKHRSLKSRPGARKRKEQLVAMEMERFGKNMAMMAAGSKGGKGDTSRSDDKIEGEEQGAGSRSSGSAQRWAAIRGFISQTMEKRNDASVQMEKG